MFFFSVIGGIQMRYDDDDDDDVICSYFLNELTVIIFLFRFTRFSINSLFKRFTILYKLHSCNLQYTRQRCNYSDE